MNDLIYKAHKTVEYFHWAISKDIFEEKGVIAFAPAIQNPNPNIAFQKDDFEDGCEARIDDVEEFFHKLALSWSWIIDPTRDQKNLIQSLERRGYTPLPKHPVMIFSLDHPFPENHLKKFDVREVSKEDLTDWIAPLEEGFQSTHTDALAYLEVHQRALGKKADFRHFVAYFEDKPVSAGTLSLSSFGARLDDIGTRPSFQRKGYAMAITLYAMKVAKELGYPWVCLEASDEGLLLYKKIGFTELYLNEMYEKKK